MTEQEKKLRWPTPAAYIYHVPMGESELMFSKPAGAVYDLLEPLYTRAQVEKMLKAVQ